MSPPPFKTGRPSPIHPRSRLPCGRWLRPAVLLAPWGHRSGTEGEVRGHPGRGSSMVPGRS